VSALVCKRLRAQTNEQGSALLLVPATFLIVLMLALFALNSALTFLAVQELERKASSAANDAASGLARDGYFVAGGYSLDENGAKVLAGNSSAERADDSLRKQRAIVVTRVSDTTIRATAYGHSISIISKLIPWTDDEIKISVEAEAYEQ
jgi:hypothetical protein